MKAQRTTTRNTPERCLIRAFRGLQQANVKGVSLFSSEPASIGKRIRNRVERPAAVLVLRSISRNKIHVACEKNARPLGPEVASHLNSVSRSDPNVTCSVPFLPANFLCFAQSVYITSSAFASRPTD